MSINNYNNYNNWSDEKEKKINEYKNVCEVYIIAHDKNREKYSNYIFEYFMCNIIIPLIISILGIVIYFKPDATIIINTIIVILSSILSTCGVIASFYDPTKKLSSHTDTRNKYKHIVYKIEQELFFEPHNRKDCNVFVREICKEMLELETGENSLPIINKNTLLKEKNKQISIKNIKLSRHNHNNSISHIQCCDIENNSDSSANNSNNSSINNSNNSSINNGNNNAVDDQIINNVVVNNQIVINNDNNNSTIDDDDDDDDDDMISGLTIDENTNFKLLFKRMPSLDANLMKYQRERLNR
jgi:hypothetical protein